MLLDYGMCALANAISPNSKGQSGWICSKQSTPTDDLCTWAGLTCSSDNVVTDIQLGGFGLTGTLPPQIGLLSSITHIELNDNLLHGTVPAQLNQLSNLVYYDISRNSLQGTFPSDLSSLQSLQFLALSGNSFTGSIPSSLCSMDGLTSLYFNGNAFNCYWNCITDTVTDLKNNRVTTQCTAGTIIV